MPRKCTTPRKNVPGTVYIIEFSEPFHHAKYYVGWCENGNLMDRFEQHLSGHGARICAAVVASGRTLSLIYATPGTRSDERRIKNRKNTPRLVEQLRAQGVARYA